MKAARECIEAFTKSTQNMEKLVKFQLETAIAQYASREVALKVIQDVPTRWWSTVRCLRRLRFLKKAIMSLVASEEVKCAVPTEDQWAILHQIEIALEPMAEFQRTLEGDSYVTGSLAILAVYQIRRQYVDVLESDFTLGPVCELTKVLLKDFDERFVPADEEGHVRYTGRADIGKGNRYIYLHPYFMIASLLDPRVKGHLFGHDPERDYLMTESDYHLLKKDVIEFMVEQKLATMKSDVAGAKESAATGEAEKSSGNLGKAIDKIAQKWGSFAKKPVAAAKKAADRAAIVTTCTVELEEYLQAEGLDIQALNEETGKIEYTNPLVWWKDHADDFPVVAKLARVFLSIPATSAPSERVWSEASQVISAKRASLSKSISSGIMFVKRNIKPLTKYYKQITKGWEDVIDLEYFGLSLPAADEIDIGIDDPFAEEE